MSEVEIVTLIQEDKGIWIVDRLRCLDGDDWLEDLGYFVQNLKSKEQKQLVKI